MKKFIAIMLSVFLLSVCTSCGYSSGSRTIKIGIFSGSYWGTPSNDCYHVLDNAIERFKSENIGVEVEYVNGIAPDAYSEWLAQQIIMGTEPDVFFVLPEDFDLLVSSGVLADLDTMISNDDSFNTSAYYDVCLTAGQSNGSQYALPYESVPTMMFVNMTLLKENGIPIPDNNWTWDDFYDICERVTDVEARQFGVYGYDWIEALYSNGAELFSESGNSCNLSDERIQEAIRFVQKIKKLNNGYTVSSQDFDLGRVAFRPFLFSDYRAYQPYPWRVKRYTGFEWECVCMPAGPNGDNTSELSTMLLGISSRSKNQELAWEFIKLLSYDEDIQTEIYTSSHGISPLPAIAESPEMLKQLYDSIPGSVDFSGNVISKIMRTAVIAPKFDNYDQAMSMALNAVEMALLNSESLQTRLIAAQREINNFLSRS